DDRISTRIREPISAQPAPAARPRRSQQGLGQPVARQPRALRSTGSENHDMRAAAVKPSQRTRARPLNLVSTGSGGGSGGIGSGSGVPRTPRTPRTPVRLSGSPAPDGFPELAPLPSAPLSARAARPPRLPPAKQRRHTLAPPVSQQQQTQTQTQQVVEIDLSSSPMLPAPEALLGLAVADDDDDGRLPAEGAHEAIQAPVVVLRPPPLQKPRRITRRTSASLRDSLSRLPGAKGVARTQLTSKRRRVLAHQDTPPRLPSPGAADPGDPADPVDPADPADAVDSAGSVDPRGSAELAPPPSPPPTTAPTTAPTTPLPTRFTLATLTGFASAAEQRRATQQLRSRRTISVTDDPMLADVCVSGGPLARKLKVLCALARGTPLVDVRWIADTESGDPVDDYVPESPDVEALWGVSVRETLARARRGADEGCRLLAGFCVHIDESVAEARDISVLACAAGAYVLGVTRPGRRGSAEPHESLALEPAGWSTAGTLSDGSSGSGSSSTEPDDDADSDWDAKADGRVQRPRGRRRPRKTLPRLSVRPKLQREPSLVLAAPAAVSRSTSATSTASLAKRRRIDSPRLESAEGALALVEMLKRQRVELGVPPEARLLVVVEELRAPRGVREQWVVGGALVVAPEDIIQSVLHCELTFLP
ncbi:Mediator of DNA damage checkpoint protein 1, partial [Coemansia erecta]